MGTDNLYKRRKQEREARISKERKLRAETWLFVCEGTETEPNYFESLLNYINERSDKEIKFTVEGTGRNTESLVRSIDGFFTFTDECKTKANIPYGKIFAVFDKDSFEKEQFNKAITLAERKGYIALWSNECIELWFLLHFSYFQSNIHRTKYFAKLGQIFGCKYEKADSHFKMLDSEKRLKNAWKNAKRLYATHEETLTPSEKAPCTTLFKLIDEISIYTGIEI